MKTFSLVIPTIREASITRFFDEWKFDHHDVNIIVVEDNPTCSFTLPEYVTHYAWDDIHSDLGSSAWIIPRRSDCVRSYGYYKAWQSGSPYIVTLDDDCYPYEGQTASTFLRTHECNLTATTESAWYSTLEDMFPRGYPYGTTHSHSDTWISHGLWTNVPDYDSVTQLVVRRNGPFYDPIYREGYVPYYQMYPMCGMNLAWRRDATPLLYFLRMGSDSQDKPYVFDRFGDIWAGLFSKRILDHLSYRVYSGKPYVHHDRASNVWANFRREHEGIIEHENLWPRIHRANITGSTPTECYRSLATTIDEYGTTHHNSDIGVYWKGTAQAMQLWSELYECTGV